MKCMIVPVTAYQQNCSVLLCEKTGKAAVIDPGGDIDRIVDALEKMGGELEKIFVTHGHIDHCAAADQLRQRYAVAIEGPQQEDKFWLDKLPEWSQMGGFPPTTAFTPDRWLEQGDTVQFGAETLEVHYCPGHTPGHVVFFHAGLRLAFVGDVLFQGSIGRTDFPRGNHQQLLDSIRQRLWPLGDDVEFVPGHGPTSTFGQERKTNPFVADPRFG